MDPRSTPPASTLHLADGGTTTTARQCVRVAPEPSGCELVIVAFDGSAARWLDGWQAAVGDPPRATFVAIDAAAWHAGHPRERIESAAAPDATVRTELVDSPGNLTDLGVTLTQRLEAYDASAPRTILCLQSLTVLLQYSASDEVYQFLHTLLTQLDRFDATGHFHLHEGAHDQQTVDTLRPLFDRVRRDGDEGAADA